MNTVENKMKRITATTKSGKTYNVRFTGVNEKIFKKCYSAELEITPDKWVDCELDTYLDREIKESVPCINLFNPESLKVIGVPEDIKKITIKVDQDWRPLQEEALKEAKARWKEIANSAQFTKVSFYNNTLIEWAFPKWVDCELDEKYCEYNDLLIKMKDSLKYIKTGQLVEFRTGADIYDYHSQYFECKKSDVEKIVSFSLPGLEKSGKLKREKEEQHRLLDEKIQNIRKGAIYFTAESERHDEDITQIYLTRPAPNSGSFTLDHRVSKSDFAIIAKFGRYYSADFLEECDIFCSEPGWRFTGEAINNLLKEGKEVYINYKKVEDQ